MSKILQFKITLKRTNPKIWRRIQVEDSMTFHDLHLVIQHAMGWMNYHLHQFIYDRNNYIGDPELLEMDNIANSKEIPLSEFFNKPKMQMEYEYDFGDGWYHELVLEKIIEPAIGKFYPACTAGEKSCPPEDCGSIPGFYNMLEIIKNKKRPEYKEMMEWLGEDYDPDEFDMDQVNEFLNDYKSIDEQFDGNDF